MNKIVKTLFYLSLMLHSLDGATKKYKRNSMNQIGVNFVDHTDATHVHDKIDKDHIKSIIKNVKGIFVCSNDQKCEKIKEYEIASNISFNCYEKNLAINYKTHYTVPNGTVAYRDNYGYLIKDMPFISRSQTSVKACLQIKR